MPELRIGISGWNYGGWRGKFYPEGLPHRRELEFASRQVNSIEINGSFYSLQTPDSYRRWREETPEDFVFAVKGGRFITHMKKLLDPVQGLANFFASGVFALEEKLGPFLWQLPPQLSYDPERIEKFLRLLPREGEEASRLARKHDARVSGRSLTRLRTPMRFRHAMEVRHDSFMVPQFIEQLERHGVAWVVADAPARWPYLENVTADFIYLRLHGDEELYASGYGDPALERWKKLITDWRNGKQKKDAVIVGKPVRDGKKRDVFAYFDNDAKVHAPLDAIRLAGLLGLRRGAGEFPGLRRGGTRETRARSLRT